VVQYADRMLYFAGPGQPPVMGTPDEILRQIPLAPPLISLARQLNWSPLPLTIKAGRAFARDVDLKDGFAAEAAQREKAKLAGAEPAVMAVRDVWFSYNGDETLKGIDSTFGPGQLVALMGRNGSGKTTLLKNMVGLLRPHRGRVELGGQDTRPLNVQTIARTVGYVPQNPDALLFSDTIAEEVDFTRRSHGLAAGGADALLERLGLQALRSSYPRDLSGGERQRVALAAILAGEPEIILLDEPTRGLDYQQKRALAEFLREKTAEGKTIIMATHDVELVARCADRVIILGDGQVILDGTTRETMRQSMVFSSQISKLFPDHDFLTEDEVFQALGRGKQACA
jgi:energy-coupling factor transporter ATP-binding protein EcfA2